MHFLHNFMYIFFSHDVIRFWRNAVKIISLCKIRYKIYFAYLSLFHDLDLSISVYLDFLSLFPDWSWCMYIWGFYDFFIELADRINIFTSHNVELLFLTNFHTTCRGKHCNTHHLLTKIPNRSNVIIKINWQESSS